MTYQGPMPSRLRLLILAPFAPRLDTPHGGGRVLAQFLAEISQRHRVALLYLQACQEPPADPALMQLCELAHSITRPFTGTSTAQKIRRNLRLMAGLLKGKPMWVTDWESQAFASLTRSVVSSWQPDLVQIEYHVMAQYLTALNDCPAPRILVEYEAARRGGPFLKFGPPLFQSAAHHFDRSAWEKFEPAVIRQVQAVVAFTENDQKVIESYGLPTPISLIPFGTNSLKPGLNSNGSETPSLLFVGNFNHPPNTEAAFHLAHNIFPVLRSKYPNLACYIVGPNPPQTLKQRAGNGVTITGWVPDLTPYFDHATIFVAALHTGGGMRVKILEAMMAGKAIVTTPLAVEGLKIQNGEQLLLAESDADMIRQIEWLLVNPQERAALSANAHAWACANLGWEKTIQAYERLYQSLLRGDKS